MTEDTRRQELDISRARPGTEVNGGAGPGSLRGAENPQRSRGNAARWILSIFMVLVIMALTLAGVYWIQAIEKPPAPVPVPSAVPVMTVRVTPRPFVHQLPALGTVKAFQEAALSAKVSGPVSRVPKGIELGTRLQRNDLLAEIDPAPFRIEVAYRLALLARAKAERSRAEAVAKRQKALIGINQEKLRLARAEWSRLKGLFESKLTPEQEMERSELLVRRTQEDLQRAERALEEAEGQSAISVSNISAAEAELSRARQALSDTRLRAPFKGVISEKSVTVGEVVSPGTVLFRVVDHEVVRVQIRAPAADIRQVRSGLPASIRVEGFEKPFPGRVAYIGPLADTRTRTFPIEILVDNRGGERLLPGMFARVTIPLKSYPSAILVPRAAVIHRGKDPFVFVVDPSSGTARRRTLRISRAFGSRLLVTEGLRAGDRLVTSGQHLLKDGAKVRVIQSRSDGDRSSGE